MSRQAWKRKVDEPDAAYAVFSEWLHSTDSDGQRMDVYSWAEGRAETPEWRSFVMAWADHHKWEDRARAYDDHASTLIVKRVYPLVSPLFMSFYRMARIELDKYEKAQANSSEAPGFIDLRLIVRIVDMLSKAEGKIQEFALREKEIANSAGSSEVAVDYSRLTVDELRTLEALTSKAMVEK